jgi:hypothetical protein
MAVEVWWYTHGAALERGRRNRVQGNQQGTIHDPLTNGKWDGDEEVVSRP